MFASPMQSVQGLCGVRTKKAGAITGKTCVATPLSAPTHNRTEYVSQNRSCTNSSVGWQHGLATRHYLEFCCISWWPQNAFFTRFPAGFAELPVLFRRLGLFNTDGLWSLA